MQSMFSRENARSVLVHLGSEMHESNAEPMGFFKQFDVLQYNRLIIRNIVLSQHRVFALSFYYSLHVEYYNL